MRPTLGIISGFFFVLLLLIAIGVGLYFVQRGTTYVGEARNPPQTYNLENSYVFASPLTARADGREKIRVTVFLLSEQGLGVPQRQIAISAEPLAGGPSTTRIETVQAETDGQGQAVFEVASQTPGKYQVLAQVEGKVFPQAVNINFE